MHSPAGQSIAYFNAVRSVAEVMASLVQDTASSLQRLGSAAPAITESTP